MESFRILLERAFDLTGSNRLSDDDWNIVNNCVTRKSFSKKEVLTKMGAIEKKLFFIEQGVARFFIPKEENDLTFNIVFENGFLSAYDSFITQTPSTYSIDTLTDVILWECTFDNLQAIYKNTNIGNRIGRKASEDLFLKKQKRELSLLNQSAEERYLSLFNEQPRLIQQIPLKYISSYIGITPQALSRIRRRIHK